MTSARIVITAAGEVAVFVEEGTFQTAEKQLEALWKLLEVEGVSFDTIDQPEQHRHDAAHAHQLVYNQGAAHTHSDGTTHSH